MADMTHSNGVLFHTDAVQAVGKVPIALRSSRIDMLSLSGHKLHGPKGTGALYLRRGVPFRPLLQGGHQERERRAGTENVPALVGLGKAAELALQYMDYEATLVSALRDRLQAGILTAVPGTIVTGDLKNRLPNTLNFIFPAIDGDDLLLLLNKQGIAVSTGSACSSGSREPSHVLQAMGFSAAIARGAMRFSLSRCNTLDEVERVIHALPPLVDYLRRLSPAWEEAATVA
jgi:cysteine desulfurase